MKKPNGYWTFERCRDEALKFNTKKEFFNENSSAYVISKRNKWLDNICSHMIYLIYPDNYWDFEKCKQEALKYKTKIDFLNNSQSAYLSASKNKWFEDICGHMNLSRKPNGYWTYDKCKEEALKYQYKIDFKKNSSGAYCSSRKFGWLENICKHMIIIGDKYKRCIYVWEFEDNSAYIGLTSNLKKRINCHKYDKKSPVFNHLKICIGNYRQLTDYIEIKNAKYMEKNYILNYKENGWFVLNKTKGGEIGIPNYYNGRKNEISNRKPRNYWSFDKCLEESSKYKNRRDFRVGSISAYNKSLKNNWLNIICEY